MHATCFLVSICPGNPFSYEPHYALQTHEPISSLVQDAEVVVLEYSQVETSYARHCNYEYRLLVIKQQHLF